MQSNKTNFLTASDTHSTASPHNPVLEVYKELNKTIDDMDNKVQHVIKKHQAQFLYAYRNHISKIKKQLAEIRHKSEEQEKMFSSNDRIQYLQKQMVIFREEALKLYAKLDEKTQENQYMKNKIKEFQKEHQLKEMQDRDQIRTFKIQEMSKSVLQCKIEELESTLSKKDQDITRLTKQMKLLKEESLRKSQIDLSSARLGSLASSRRGESLKQKVKKVQVYDSQMKEWFLDCVKTVKRQIAMRNNNSHLMDLSRISSIDQFKTVDKLRLLELFLQNQKLLSWMYERIFPDRLSQLRSKVSSNNDSFISNEKEGQQMNMSQIERGLLPKVGRTVRSQLRNSLIIKQGKLNISNL